MLFDKLSLFSDGQSVSVSGSNSTTLTFFSKEIDLRFNGQIGIDGGLRIYGQIVDTVNAKGAITTTLQTSADGASWTDVASASQDGRKLIAMFLPCVGLKRFVRLKFTSVSPASSAEAATVAVKAGLVDQFDIEEVPSVADPFSDADPVALADKIRKAREEGPKVDKASVNLSRASADQSTGVVVYVTNTLGPVTAAVTLNGSTSTHVTATKDSSDPTKWTLKSTSSITAANYLVTFTDPSWGKSVAVTVVGSTAT